MGNITGGNAGLAYGLNNSSGSGTINLTGNVTAGSSSVSAAIGMALSTATLLVSGNVNGGASGAGSQGEGIRVGGAGSCTVTGLVTGGGTGSAYGIRGMGGGNITVTGQAIGGVAAPAINNESTGQVTVTRAVGNGFGGGSVGLSAAVGVSNVANQSSITIVEQIEFGTLGQSPVNGRIRLKKMGTNVAVFNFCDTAGAKTLIDATTNAAMPAATNVRFGTSYASGALTGSAYIPSAGSVAFGVPVDATTGTATLTAANGRAAIGMGSANLDTQLAAIPTAITNADAVRTNLATELGRIDATISSRSTLTAANVRTELAPELTEIGEIHAIHGLDIANALTVTPTLRSAGAITQAITGDGTTSTIVTRV